MIIKERIIFDFSSPDSADNIGAIIRSKNGSLITHTDVNTQTGLDVNIINEQVPVIATDLDIRALNYTLDSIEIINDGNALKIEPDGSINVNLDSVRITDGTSTATITPALSGPVAALDVAIKNSLFSKPFTKLEILSKNSDGNPLEIKTFYESLESQLATLQYDIDGDLVSVEVNNL